MIAKRCRLEFFYTLCAISISISMQKTRRVSASSQKLWPKNSPADTLTLCRHHLALTLNQNSQFSTYWPWPVSILRKIPINKNQWFGCEIIPIHHHVTRIGIIVPEKYIDGFDIKRTIIKRMYDHHKKYDHYKNVRSL